MPKVSIIMGVYNENREAMLNRAVDSICGQTFTDWEFIICDDGSSDGTWNLLERLSQKDTRIKIIKNESNRGLAYSLNHCIQYSAGEYIARQDADDYSVPFRIQRQIEFLDEHLEYSLVGSNAYVIDDNKTIGQMNLKEKPQKDDFLWNSPFIHPTIMMRKRDLLRAECYRVAKETFRAQDYDLFMRLYSKGMKGYNIQEYLFYYFEGKSTFKKRKFKYRINEAKIRYKGFKSLHLFPKAIPFVVKPLAVGLIPKNVFISMRQSRYSIKKNINENL